MNKIIIEKIKNKKIIFGLSFFVLICLIFSAFMFKDNILSLNSGVKNSGGPVLNISKLQNSGGFGLSWNPITTGGQNYFYRIYRKSGNTSQLIGDYQTVQSKDTVKVLNIYPSNSVNLSGEETYTTWRGETKTLPKTASLEKWMEEPNATHPKGFGMGLIDVDSIPIDVFNANSTYYINKDTEYYDVIYFGTWDCYGSCDYVDDLNNSSLESVKSFIRKGRGLLMGHDTIYGLVSHPNMNSLSSIMNIDVSQTNVANMGSSEVIIKKRGTLTSYPWVIGDVGSVLSIPYTHGVSQSSKIENIWMSFNGDFSNDEINFNGTTNSKESYLSYLSTYNNTALIQTGHSNGQATADEQKVLANTLFYLSQTTLSTSFTDKSAQDYESPVINKVSHSITNNNSLSIDLDSVDKGTYYGYYISATGLVNGAELNSAEKFEDSTSGLKGYSYIVSTTKEVPDNTVDSTNLNNLNLNYTKGSNFYLNIKAIDNAGNTSDVTHYFIDVTSPLMDLSYISPNDNKINIKVVTSDEVNGSGIDYILLPNGNKVYSRETTYTVTSNGTYTFKVYDKAGNETIKTETVSNLGSLIDEYRPKLTITPKHSENFMDLKWTVPLDNKKYSYRIYKKGNGEEEYKSIQSKESVNVLNIYIDSEVTNTGLSGGQVDLEGKSVPDSGILKTWLLKENISEVNIDTVSLGDFNRNPEKYLNKVDGMWNYDSVFYGMWNLNPDVSFPNDYSVDYLRSFINDGGGFMTSHHTLGYLGLEKGVNKLADLMGVEIFSNQSYDRCSLYSGRDYSGNLYPTVSFELLENVMCDYSSYWPSGHKITISKKGLLTNYPFNVGEVGDEFTVPYQHGLNVFGKGDVWLETLNPSGYYGIPFKEITFSPKTGEKGTNNFYIHTFNNTAIVNSGHSFPDISQTEVRVIANTLYYLSQVTTNTSWEDRSGQDYKGPEKPEVLNYDSTSNPNYISLNYSRVEDVGTEYTYKVEAKGLDYGNILESNEETKEIKSGLKGYSILIDNIEDSIPDNIIETNLTSYKVAHNSTGHYYVHIAAVDNAGNISEVTHLYIDDVPPELLLSVDSTDMTKDPVTITSKASDNGSGVDYIVLPDGKKIYSELATFEVRYNGTYSFKAYDKNGNFVEKDIVIDFINNKPELRANLKDIYNGDVLKNKNALYSELSPYNILKLKVELFDKDVKPSNDKLKVEYSIYDLNYSLIESKVLLDNYEVSGKWNNPYNGYFDIDVTNYTEGYYKMKIKVTDSLLEYSEEELMFLVDKTTPLGILNASKFYDYGIDIEIKDLSGDISGLDEKTLEFFDMKNKSNIFKPVSGNYDLVDGLKVRLNKKLESNTKYTYKMNIKDKVGHIYESNIIEYITSLNLVEKDLYYDKDRPNKLNIEWTNSLIKSDDLSLEIYRNGSLIDIIDSGNVYIDKELDYERSYVYEFIVVGKDINGNRLESLKTKAVYTTGSPILIVDGESIIYKSLFSDKVKTNFILEFMQGGSVLVDYEDFSGKISKRFSLNPKIKNNLDFELSARDNQVIPFSFKLEGNNVHKIVNKSVTVEEIIPVVKDISPKDYNIKYNNK